MTFTTTQLNKQQIISYMVDVLGWSEDQDRLNTETTADLWDMLSEEEQHECEEYNV
jgi:hypothetical protein